MSSDVPVGTVWTSKTDPYASWELTRHGLMHKYADQPPIGSALSTDELDNDPCMTRHLPGTWPPKPAPSAACKKFVADCAEVVKQLDVIGEVLGGPTLEKHQALMRQLRTALALAEKEHPNA